MRSDEQSVRPVVKRARARLARIAGREGLMARAWWALLLGVAAGVSRPLLWPTRDDAPLWLGLARSLALLAAGFAAASIGLIVLGRRRKPSELGAARAIDEARGLSEVVASGFAFERDDRREPVVTLARAKAVEAAQGLDVNALFPLPSLLPSKRTLGRAALCLCGALCLGAYDRSLWGAMVSPPTESEAQAAVELEHTVAAIAEQLAHPPADPARPDRPQAERGKSEDKGGARGPKLAETAREAARAARRGDRQGALEKLDELRSGGRQQGARAAELSRTLRKIADSLAKPAAGEKATSASRAASPSAKAAEELRLLAKKVREPQAEGSEGKESEERTLERLERAGEEAEKASGQEGKGGDPEGAAQKLAGAMKQAAAALHRGDRAEAAAMLERAAEHGEAMEKARAEAAAEAAMVVEMLEKSDALERAIELAMLGKEGEGEGQGEGKEAQGAGQGDGEGQGKGKGAGEGQGAGEGKGKGQGAGKSASKGGGGKGGGSGKGSDLRRAIALRLAALGFGTESGTGTDGGGQVPDRQRSHHAALEAKGSIRAPSEVSEGERAIQAIQGLGKGSEAPASYKEVFPSYDAAVEEGLDDERIPPARRSAVRRYFQAIRPEQP